MDPLFDSDDQCSIVTLFIQFRLHNAMYVAGHKLAKKLRLFSHLVHTIVCKFFFHHEVLIN